MRDISARELKGHNILAVERFWDNTRWMIEFTKCKPVVKSQGAAFHDAVFARGLELHHPWPCKDL